MTNTYAINTTRGKEFDVEAELIRLGLHPWVPRRLESKYIKEKRQAVWYDRPYVPKLMFCVIPAVYWRDVFELKHVIGKPSELSRLDIEGQAGCIIKRPDGSQVTREPRYGLKDFRNAVEAEYQDMQRRKVNSEYQCQYEPGQALELLDQAFADLGATFVKVVRDARGDYAKLRVEMEMMGRAVTVDVDPDKVRASR